MHLHLRKEDGSQFDVLSCNITWYTDEVMGGASPGQNLDVPNTMERRTCLTYRWV
jgi:hypothetical protein